jgi:hypothetical protein
MLVTVHLILDQIAGYCSHYFGSGFWLLFRLFWIRLLVTVHIILGQAVGYCSHYFGSGCWLLFRLFSITLLVTVHIILNSNQQSDPKSPEQLPTASSKIVGTLTNSLVQNNRNSNQRPGPK